MKQTTENIDAQIYGNEYKLRNSTLVGAISYTIIYFILCSHFLLR